MFSVPPLWGAPVPGLSPCQPAVSCPCCPVPPLPLVDELLHAAASMVRATAPVTMAKARGRKCLTTLFLLSLLGEDRSRRQITRAPCPTRCHQHAGPVQGPPRPWPTYSCVNVARLSRAASFGNMGYLAEHNRDVKVIHKLPGRKPKIFLGNAR